MVDFRSTVVSAAAGADEVAVLQQDTHTQGAIGVATGQITGPPVQLIIEKQTHTTLIRALHSLRCVSNSCGLRMLLLLLLLLIRLWLILLLLTR